MHAYVDESCIGCGACPDICPEIFSLNDDGLATAFEGQVPDELDDLVLEAEESCPVNAIYHDH